MEETILLIFSLAFFLFVIWLMVRSEQESYDRRIREMREFGFELKDKRPRRKFFEK